MARTRPKVDLIPAERYPSLLPRTQRLQAMVTLRSDETLAAANSILALQAEELRGVVLDQSRRLKAAAKAIDWPAVYAASHEIRGLAANAGLGATGEIANGFCHYLDAVGRRQLKPEASVVRLHVDAIARSARTSGEAVRHGEAVTQKLAELVARKLARLKDSETP